MSCRDCFTSFLRAKRKKTAFDFFNNHSYCLPNVTFKLFVCPSGWISKLSPHHGTDRTGGESVLVHYRSDREV